MDKASKAKDADDIPHGLNPGDELHQVVCQNTSHAPANMNTWWVNQWAGQNISDKKQANKRM